MVSKAKSFKGQKFFSAFGLIYLFHGSFRRLFHAFDICGATKKIHLIFTYKGKNLLWKKEPRCETDTLSHTYTAVIKADKTYEVLVDQEKKESGKLEEDWDFLKPATIPDPDDKKPADWVDDPEMVDPEEKKPADWDKEPATIPDPDATQPEDWDEEEDGKWEPPAKQSLFRISCVS